MAFLLSRLHNSDTLHSEGVFWTSDEPEGRPVPDNKQLTQISMPLVGITPASGVPRGVVSGVQTPPRNSEDIGAVLDHMSMKNRRLDFLLQFNVFSYGCNLLNKGFF